MVLVILIQVLGLFKILQEKLQKQIKMKISKKKTKFLKMLTVINVRCQQPQHSERHFFVLI